MTMDERRPTSRGGTGRWATAFFAGLHPVASGARAVARVVSEKHHATCRRAVGFVLALVAAAVPSGATGETVFDPSLPRVIVEFTEMPADVGQRFADVGITHAALFPGVDAAAVVGSESAYHSIAGWSDVVGVTPDKPFELYMWEAKETTRVNLVRVGAKPLKMAYTGKGVTIAVVDSGVDTSHPDLAGGKVVSRLDFAPSRIFRPTTEALIDPDQQDPVIEEPIYEPVGTDDGGGHGHGTMMASVAGGTGAAALGADMSGAAPGAALVDLDVGDGAYVYGSSVFAALEWLVKHRNDPVFPGGIRVAAAGWGNACSDGLSCETPLLRKALKRAIASGTVVVVAAGTAADGDLTYPARYPEMISVKGACKDQDDWSGGCQSDRTFDVSSSDSTDVVAPGFAVWAAQPTQGRWQGSNPTWSGPLCEQKYGEDGCSPVPGQGDAEAELNNKLWYGIYVSHSVATAHVAGIAALLLEANPALTHSDVETILQATARDLGPKGFDESSGYGMVDAWEAVKAAERRRAQ